MKKIFLYAFLHLLFMSALGQTPSPGYQPYEPLEQAKRLRHSADSILNPRTFEAILSRMFSQNSTADGRWVYYPDKANTQRIEKPEISKILPGYGFYTVRLTNYLGYHINSSTNLLLFDSANARMIHAVPMWYGDISADLLTLFIGKSFADSTSLLRFTAELQDLMNVGSTGEIENTKYGENKITFDLTYQGANRKEVWRHVEMLIADNTIKNFRSTNPQMNESVTVP